MAKAVRALKLPGEAMLNNQVVLLDLLEALKAAGADYVVVGGLAAGYHGRMRATVDVDLLVPRKSLKRLGALLRGRGYTVKEHPDMTRVYHSSRDEAVADLVAREANPTLRAAAKEVERVTVLDLPRISLVRKGAFVALKFHAAVSPTRQVEDRLIDAGDIGRVLRRGLEPKELASALRIAETIHPGASKELQKMLDDLAAGRSVTV